MIRCPKCDYEQPDGLECIRCGIVYSKFRGQAVDPAAAGQAKSGDGDEDDDAPKWGGVWVPPDEEKVSAGAGTWILRVFALIAIVALAVLWQFAESGRNSEAFVILERFVKQDRIIYTDLVGRLGDVEIARFFEGTIDEQGGTAMFTLPLTGHKGAGSVHAVLARSRGVWDIQRAIYTDRQGLQHSLIASEVAADEDRGRVLRTPWDPGAAPIAALPRRGPPPFSGWLSGPEGHARALAMNETSPRPMVVYFHAEHCKFSLSFEEQLLPHPAVAAFLSGVVHVEIDPTTGPEAARLASEYGVTGFPTFLVLGPDGGGSELPAFYETGGVTPENFAAEARRALSRL